MTTHTIDTLMALADSYAAVSAVSTTAHAVEVQAALRTALTEALQPVRERKVISKAFCNPNQYDGEELAYNNDYLNE